MIFVTVGSQKFEFSRLLRYINNLIIANIINEPVFAQIGNNIDDGYLFETSQFIDRSKFREKMAQSDIVITHAGTGAIVGALEMDKCVIAVPRQKDFNEHVDNHQFEIANAFQSAGYIEMATSEVELATALDKLKSGVYKKFKSNTSTYILYLESYLNKIVKPR
ncbi:beta(1,3)galactosyltransferase EpsH [Lactobacillus sp. DCY120]|uniref:Beta(1,3)galactosyltransferase EpsH n=1 Tax=Bombilactobacillus apium TaxID=2675299 RepID=A0A850R6N7_9LACO|nr:glycosyltransferase [Bombilactobacillus apium]NVY96205.1 beta(1,3)galactosyltransferase EpsH [Bombilactobacillus apium]